MGNADVYDIEVDTTHRFISNGIISHNSAKSALKDWIVYQLGAESCSQRTSKVGLTGCASGEEITPGALARAHNKVLCIDELDKFNNEDRQALLESMEEGVVLIEAGGMTARFDAECRIVACANLIDKFSPELLDRFDFRIEMKASSTDTEKRIVCAVLDHWFESKEGYDGRDLGAYIQWTKSFEPVLPRDVREKAKLLIQMLIDLEESVRGSMRKKESVLRVAFTIAKIHKRNVEVRDFISAIKLLFPTMNEGKIQALEQLAVMKT
jgi:DNA replicative helicase MCM subunit Mcm2 (Cdc46/Mcm family)